MSNKDVTDILRRIRKQKGVTIISRHSGRFEVHGPHGFYIVHSGLSDGAPLHTLRKELRQIGVKI